MNVDQYHSKLEELEQRNGPNLIALGKWVQDEALPWLWIEFAGVILTPREKHPLAQRAPAPQKLLPMKDADAVRHGLCISRNDWNKRTTDPLFYQAQLTMLDAEAKRYCASIDEFAKDPARQYGDAIINTLHPALQDLLGYAIVLLEDAGREVAEVPSYFAAWRRKQDHPFEVFKGAEQIIYGVYSGLAQADRAPYMPVAVLRTAIELRLRHAFGVYSLVDQAKPDELIPLDLSKVFDAILTQQNEIEFSVNVHDVRKIYKWSNFYLHGGIRDYPWVPGFLLQYLRPLFGDSGHVDGGIRMKRESWHAVRDAVTPSSERPKLFIRLVNAWRTLFGKPRKVELPAVDEEVAQCVFKN